MKKITLLSAILLIICGSTSFAQTVQKETGLLQYKSVGGDILTADGVKLSEDDLRSILSEKQFAGYQKSSSTRRKGFINTTIGTSLLVTGGGLFIYGSILNNKEPKKTIKSSDDISDALEATAPRDGTTFKITGGAIMIAGIILDSIGIPMFLTGQHNLKGIVKDYNSKKEAMVAPVVSWGVQEYGYGIALRF